MALRILLSIVVFLGLLSVRAYAILPKRRKFVEKKRPSTDKCKLAVFLGSGGHTSESIALVSTLDFKRYSPRIYLISEGDSLSAKKAEELEMLKAGSLRLVNEDMNYSILVIPRTRRVHQSLLTTPSTALRSLLASLYHFTYLPFLCSRPFAEVLILNGPGTCFILCIAALASRFLAIPSPRLIYVESFARVKSLSLSGKLLRPLVDRFVVQWPDALADGGRGECRGWLV